ncbi:MAG: AAA family ATPase [Myxococcales bacterium]|nr:AAA family ATPase [Myxococcales bacterium]
MQKTGIGFLHFTDLHQGVAELDTLWASVEEQIYQDLERLHKDSGPWHIVFFSGDLTQRGSCEEFVALQQRLNRMWERFAQMGSSPVLLTVPGNHDLVRPPPNKATVKAIGTWNNDADIQTEFWKSIDNEYRNEIIRAFANYTSWSDNTLRPVHWRKGILPGEFSATYEYGGIRLGVVGLNSAYLQLTGANYKERLHLDIRQLQGACGEDFVSWLNEHHCNVLMTHHPSTWLGNVEHFDAEINIPGRFIFHVCGHMHEPQFAQISNGGANFKRILQGASLFGLETWGDNLQARIHGYSAGRLLLNKNVLQLALWPRRLLATQAGHRKVAPDFTYQLNENGCLLIKLDKIKPPKTSAKQPESILFSPEITEALAKLNKNIAMLTDEQKSILDHLVEHRQVAIYGCAGSGKTLVAVEKAARLSKAGLRVLLLSHSQYLARYLQNITAGVRMDVFDVVTWIKRLCSEQRGHVIEDSGTWTPYAEPVNDEIEQATQFFASSSKRYDAIIVDEGQDFREEWWNVIRRALVDSEQSILYIFLDDNQALMPHRGKPPVHAAPFRLSRNCRNSGEIFELVRRFHSCAPEPSLSLKDIGIVKWYHYRSSEDVRSCASRAIREALDSLPGNSLVVLTAEPDPPEASILNNLAIEMPPPWRWQDAIRRALAFVKTMKLHNAPSLPTLSGEFSPTQEDIVNVERFVLAIKRTLRTSFVKAHSDQVRWVASNNRVDVCYPNDFPRLSLLDYFSTSAWVQDIPNNRIYRVVSPLSARHEIFDIPIYSIASFKGLESDGVVLFYPAKQGIDPGRPIKLHGQFHGMKTYVGASRARFLLHMVAQGYPE